MKAVFGIIAGLGYLVGFGILVGASNVLQEGIAILILTNANMFFIAALWPLTAEAKPVGKGEIGGLPFECFTDGSVVVAFDKRTRTRFPSFEMMERVLRNHDLAAGGAGKEPRLMFEGWGHKVD